MSIQDISCRSYEKKNLLQSYVTAMMSMGIGGACAIAHWEKNEMAAQ